MVRVIGDERGKAQRGLEVHTQEHGGDTRVREVSAPKLLGAGDEVTTCEAASKLSI